MEGGSVRDEGPLIGALKTEAAEICKGAVLSWQLRAEQAERSLDAQCTGRAPPPKFLLSLCRILDLRYFSTGPPKQTVSPSLPLFFLQPTR